MNAADWTIVFGTIDRASGVSWSRPDWDFARVLGSVRNDEVPEPWAKDGLRALGPADSGLRIATAGGTIVLGERVVPRGVSYLLVVEGSLGAVVTLEPVPRRAVGLDAVSYLPVPVAVTSVAVSYLPAVVVKPVAVLYRSLDLSDLKDGMLGMEDKVGGKSGRGRLGDDADEIDDPEWTVLGAA
jgi:hypothetical protein